MKKLFFFSFVCLKIFLQNQKKKFFFLLSNFSLNLPQKFVNACQAVCRDTHYRNSFASKFLTDYLNASIDSLSISKLFKEHPSNATSFLYFLRHLCKNQLYIIQPSNFTTLPCLCYKDCPSTTIYKVYFQSAQMNTF